MSYGGSGSNPDLSETFQNALTGVAKLLASLGGGVAVVAVALLTFYASQAGSQTTAQQLAQNIDPVQKALIVGLMGAGVGASYLFWGEEILSAVQLMLAGALYFTPLYFPMIFGNEDKPIMGKATGALQQGGTVYGVIALIVTVVDISLRIKERAKKGTRADQIKYGKGIKEEGQKQNVLLGKCWQLPYCRQFVKERCPIFHAKSCCWKELVGCMCEESVIRNAMENKPIPKDALLARNLIPRNNKLTVAQKKERCKTCVIYNEHQRHKYKIMVPGVLGGFGLLYLVLHGPLIAATEGIVIAINKTVARGTANAIGGFTPPHAFVEMLLGVFFLIALTYSMKVLEFMIFKVKL